MPFSTDYPNIFQWVSYHGKMTVHQIDDQTIEVALADAGGIPDDCRFRGATADESLTKANQALIGWLASNRNLLNSLISGELGALGEEELLPVGLLSKILSTMQPNSALRTAKMRAL